MTDHYAEADFSLFRSPVVPRWRAPQRGALGALLSYWSLPHQKPALVSVPTGAGKSAIAVAAPYLVSAVRVLVVVPSKDLRAQLAADFRTEHVLHAIGARSGDAAVPRVTEVSGRVNDWESLRSADVVVGLPQSLSPAHYEDAPPADLFDLIVIDEAHHAPARTWRAILDHFSSARSLLLTATPQRRDGQRIPGEIVYHYPLRQAIAEGLYKPVRPIVVDVPAQVTRDEADRRLAEEVVQIIGADEHATSSLLIRAATISRARDLAALYSNLGVDVKVLASRGMSNQERASTVEKLRTGEIRAVAVVDMLGEGFDLSRLRVMAYHDKHKSTAATVQLIGRLARVNSAYPQESVIVTPRDVDVYPQLQGIVRTLWEEDADWTRILPGLIDLEVDELLADREYAARLSEAPPELSVEAIQPGVMASLYEVSEQGWAPSFTSGSVPDALFPGQVLRARTVFYSAVTPGGSTMVVVTVGVNRPKWHDAPGLDTDQFAIHLITWRPAAQTGQSGILAVNSRDQNVVKELLDIIETPQSRRSANPRRLQDAFDSLERRSVSNVGLRTTYLGTDGVPSYRMFAGKGVDRGLRDADTGRGALGHAMAQIDGAEGSYAAGIATGKSKLWESRYVKLRQYEAHIADFVDRYWFPPAQLRGQLLPGVSRGFRVEHFPTTPLIAAIELDPALYVRGWVIGEMPLADLQIREDPEAERTSDALPLAGYMPNGDDTPIWRGWQDRNGVFHDTESALVRRGYGAEVRLSEMFTRRPPSVYYSDSQTVIGSIVYGPAAIRRSLPMIPESVLDWANVDIQIETKKNMTDPLKVSVGEALEQWLITRTRRYRHRWVLLNDGPGEIADYLVLEVSTNPMRVKLELWHAKAAGGAPAVRVTDVQELLAQAIKSRRWVTDRGLWDELGARLNGERLPKLTVLEGRERVLRVLCGLEPRHPLYSFAKYVPNIESMIGIVQPGISMSRLKQQLELEQVPIPAQQISELFTVWHDAVAATSVLEIISSV